MNLREFVRAGVLNASLVLGEAAWPCFSELWMPQSCWDLYPANPEPHTPTHIDIYIYIYIYIYQDVHIRTHSISIIVFLDLDINVDRYLSPQIHQHT